MQDTYHKLVKTTPKPNATKKSSGELVGPPPPPPLAADVVAAGGAAAEGECTTDIDDEVAMAAVGVICWWSDKPHHDTYGKATGVL